MIIALDYDKTYTVDKDMWAKFCVLAQSYGHEVICITMRFNNDEERLGNLPMSKIYYTERKAKLVWAAKNNIRVDIWIDDEPLWLFQGAS